MRRLMLVFAPMALCAACGTSDVVQPPEPTVLYQLTDSAFGEYLLYLEVPGISVEEEGGVATYSIDENQVDGVGELPLSKTSSTVKLLIEEGLATAEDKIGDLDGIQFFVNLETLRLTANDIQQLDLSSLPNLSTLEMNFNLVGELDLSSNASLDRLRYQGSAQAKEGQKLADIDLSNNQELTHLSLPNHDLVRIDLSNNLLISDELDLSGNPGPDGDPETADIVVPAQIYDQVPPENRLGVISDADVEAQVFLVVDALAIDEGGGQAELLVNLNVATPGNVEVELAFGGSATEGEDYAVGAASLMIPAGELSASTTLTAIDDTDSEGIEIIEVSIASAIGADLGPSVSGEITIDGDDLDPGFILNEVLYDPSNDDAVGGVFPGDANGDGVYVQDEDEFIELVNSSGSDLDLSGYSIWDTEAWDDDVARHVIPDKTVLANGEALVVFGGGTPTGSFGGATVQTTTTGAMNLNNSGDLLRITDANGLIVLQFDVEPLSNNPNESYTRNPDLTGGFEQHADNTKRLFSPGTMVDGSPF